VTGIGIAGTGPENFWDMGATDASGPLQPRNSVLTAPNAGQLSPAVGGNVRGTDVPVAAAAALASPFNDVINSGATLFIAPYSVSVDVSTLRAFPGFRQSVIVVANVPPDQQGSYHLATGTNAAADLGVARRVYPAPVGNVDAPTSDYEGDPRYSGSPVVGTTPKLLDAGADERR
jgi:hypothetical protein